MIDLMPVKKDAARKVVSNLVLLLLRHANNAQGSFRPAAGMATTMACMDSWDSGVAQNEMASRAKVPAIEAGLIVDDGGDLGCGGTYEAGHFGYLETIILYNPQNPESNTATNDIIHKTVEQGIEDFYTVPLIGFGPKESEIMGPHMYNYHLWIQKIKEALDPNDACDSWTYAYPSKKEQN